ncbi:MAG: hypothetical protein QXO46_08260 [Nitrososphaerota archaeon]
MKVTVGTVWDCIKLLQQLGVKYEDSYIDNTEEVTYGAYWQEDTLVFFYDSYLQSQRNVVRAILKRLKERGFIRNYKIEQYRSCISNTCRHITHDEYTLDYAEVEF